MYTVYNINSFEGWGCGKLIQWPYRFLAIERRNPYSGGSGISGSVPDGGGGGEEKGLEGLPPGNGECSRECGSFAGRGPEEGRGAAKGVMKNSTER